MFGYIPIVFPTIKIYSKIPSYCNYESIISVWIKSSKVSPLSTILNVSAKKSINRNSIPYIFYCVQYCSRIISYIGYVRHNSLFKGGKFLFLSGIEEEMETSADSYTDNPYGVGVTVWRKNGVVQMSIVAEDVISNYPTDGTFATVATLPSKYRPFTAVTSLVSARNTGAWVYATYYTAIVRVQYDGTVMLCLRTEDAPHIKYVNGNFTYLPQV